jgi:hypothetical protein
MDLHSEYGSIFKILSIANVGLYQTSKIKISTCIDIFST